ncbi:WD40/YVTN/BNR-like repeat-containing protein [Algoriphagus sediminis]|uniref:Glycosyl hydrolase n=1 Tax=Algoriphagus sediminis TaxID=3057113 RepID=A0ABT7YGC3_9BACT|nr:glycosyl hydrolase [Algoriphagus sediminis]MDN3205580.1 glycosyl hydrolase [Algoriphagus sediminis]
MKKVILLIFLLASFFASAQEVENLLPLKYRNIGPYRGGRSVTATGVVDDPLTYYFGTTGGGVWKTSDAGQHWENISDGYFGTGSVGAVAVAESNPNIVYVGMGEHAPRGVMTSYGDGVYKSTDAGKTWKKLGLEETQHISRIQIHPTNPDIVYVAAQGALFEPNEERGVYKSTDGGETWEKVLYLDAKSGAVELSMDMNTPEVLYAALWEHQRKPWQVISGGPGSGLYKTTDGGETWKMIHNGLPEAKGKMAVSVSRANSNKVYALIESDTYADTGGLFVSNDAGESWTLINKENRLTQRAWYYIEVFADPQNENTVIVQSAPMLKSIDGGRTFERLDGAHGDYHDVWFNPKNSKNIILADDGGGSISFDGGETWTPQNNMPTAQFYRINTDNQFPYRIYGGQQDNSSVVISSIGIGRGGISQEHWNHAAGGESAFLAFDPDDPRYVMGGSYLGTVELLDMKSGGSTKVMIDPIQYLGRDASDMRYRYNWNAPIIWSQHEPGTFYHASQYVQRSRDGGISWELVSPDLTRNEKEKQGKGGIPYTNEAVGAENYGTISYLAESPHEKGFIYAGSDDGLVHLTRDGGENWENITPAGLEECLINAIEVSPNDPATVYIATTRYKFNDYTPGLYKSTDYGKSWENISGEIPEDAFTRVVREDTSDPDLLFAGTELGVYFSQNGGQSWKPLQLNLPVTPITDLKVAHNDLVVATSGRSFWILDDLNLLRELDDNDKSLKIFTPDDAILAPYYSPMSSSDISDFDGTDPFEGVNPAFGAVIYYQLPEDFDDSTEVKLEIKNGAGKVIRSFTSKEDKDFQSYAGGPSPEPMLSKKPGLNRFVWNLSHDGMPGIPTAYIEAGYGGHGVIPGDYEVTLITDAGEVSATAKVNPNPDFEITMTEYQEYDEFMSAREEEIRVMHGMVNQAKAYQDQLQTLMGKLDDMEGMAELKSAGEELMASLKAWDEKMVQRRSKAYDDVENFPNKFTANYLFMINQSNSSIPKLTEGSKKRHAELWEQWLELEKEGKALIETEVPAFNKMASEMGVGVLFGK